MKVSKILSIIWAIVWRIVLLVLVLALLIAAGAAMVLNMVFTGPSETARDILTATLVEYEQTAMIPGLFLDDETVASICAVTDFLPAETSDASAITPAEDAVSAEDTVTIGDVTATVTVTSALSQSFSGGEYYAGIQDGILVVSTADSSLSGRCEKILIMDGHVNSGLYEAISGYCPRTAIGQTADGHFVLVTMEYGTYQNLIDILAEYGAVNACTVSASEE